jgi:hypothetical protein
VTISATGFAPIAAPDRSSVREVRARDDHDAAAFAGMLAHASHAAAPKPHAPKEKDATSELDGSDSTTNSTDSPPASSDVAGGTAAAKLALPAARAEIPAQTLSPLIAAPLPTSLPARLTSTPAASPAATPAMAAAGTSEVVRAVGALDPALQAKLARVIARMRDETGHDVTVAETYRSQSRQDALFAQGRETNGPVVTWTQNSKHTQGRAVDLLLDGGAAGPAAYGTLQRIAQEEGLRTLGARDPGHLELPGNALGTTATARDITTMIPSAPADASGPGQMSIAKLAQVAQVATVAQVANVNVKVEPARVARVATAATPGTTSQPGSANVGKTPPAAAAALAQTKADGNSEKSNGESPDRGAGGNQRGGYDALGSTFSLRGHDSASTPVANVAGTSAAERTERVRSAFEDAPLRPLSQLTVSVDSGNGSTDRIHVSLRGSTLNSTIDVGDARAAQAMSSRSDELVRSLTRDGIEVESLRVRAAAGTATTTVASTPQGSSSNSTGSRFERGSQWDEQERQQSGQDRREQQREQRGGKQK